MLNLGQNEPEGHSVCEAKYELEELTLRLTEHLVIDENADCTLLSPWLNLPTTDKL
jgi:hypothetical protein